MPDPREDKNLGELLAALISGSESVDKLVACLRPKPYADCESGAVTCHPSPVDFGAEIDLDQIVLGLHFVAHALEGQALYCFDLEHGVDVDAGMARSPRAHANLVLKTVIPWLRRIEEAREEIDKYGGEPTPASLDAIAGDGGF